MSFNLVSFVFQSISPELVDRVARALGLDRGIASKVLLAAVPAMLKLMGQRSIKPDGAALLATSLLGMPGDTAGRLAAMIGGPDHAQAVNHGTTMVSHLLGADGTGVLTASVGAFAGITPAVSRSLIGLAVPTIVGSLAGLSRDQKLDGAGLATLFAAQNANIDMAYPTGFAWVDAPPANAAPAIVMPAVHSAGAAAVAAAAAASIAQRAPSIPASVSVAGAAAVAAAAAAAVGAGARSAGTAAVASPVSTAPPVSSAAADVVAPVKPVATVREVASAVTSTVRPPQVTAAVAAAPKSVAVAPLQARAASIGLGGAGLPWFWLVPVFALGLYGWWTMMDRDARRIDGIRADAVRLDSEARARAVAEAAAKARAEVETKARVEAARLNAEADARARAEAEAARLKAEIEAKARAEAEAARLKAVADAKARTEAEAARGKAEADARSAAMTAEQRAKAEADAKVQADAEARYKAEADARMREVALARQRYEADIRMRAEAEAKAKLETEAKARADAEATRLKAEAARVRAEADAARQRAEAEARAKAEAEARARADAEAKVKAEADAKRVAELKACQETVTSAATSGPLRFRIASATLSADSTATLDRIVTAIKTCPSVPLTVEGHTDGDGDPAENQGLSERRAAAVVQYLSKAGVAAAQVKSIGFGATKPKAPNDTPANRAVNRRIEFVVAN